jgi:ferredoxin, 2Fe-2S
MHLIVIPVLEWEHPVMGITFIGRKNNARCVNVENGGAVMRAAADHAIQGIVAECGGNALCATCHVYVDEPWISKLGPVGDDESTFLDMTAAVQTAGCVVGSGLTGARRPLAPSAGQPGVKQE